MPDTLYTYTDIPGHANRAFGAPGFMLPVKNTQGRFCGTHRDGSRLLKKSSNSE